MPNGAEADFVTSSTIGGSTEHWHVKLFRLTEPAYVMSSAVRVFPGKTPKLPALHVQILRLMAADHDLDEIAALLHLTPNAVHAALHRMRDKFAAKWRDSEREREREREKLTKH